MDATDRELLSLIVASSHDGIAAVDRERRYTVWNPEMERRTGIPAAEAIGRRQEELFPESVENGFVGLLDRALAGERVVIAEKPYDIPRTGRRGHYEAVLFPIHDGDGAVVGAVVVGRDVTERKELERQLNRSHRLEAMGQLAGGVAHDFNNFLTAIRGFSELLALRVADDEVASGYAAEVTRAADQAAALVAQLLAFASRERTQPQPLDVGAAVRSVEELLRRVIGESIELRIRAEEAWALADPSGIEQIVVNLAVNARDAMPHGGVLEIAVRPEGDGVVLLVSDTGVGMDAGTLDRAFEPFFTTKPVGVGTGLGLATVYGTAQRCGGSAAIESEPGRGTTVRVWLPRSEPGTPAGARPHEPSAHEPRATIVLCEDADNVRAVTRAILEEAGYRVLEARDGNEALRLLADGSPVDLVLTDVVMPGMTGTELADRLAVERPDVKVAVMSAYADPGGPRAEALLRKPFTRDELLARIRDELAGQPVRRPGPTCLVADDHPPVLLAVAEALEADGTTVVGRVRDGAAALAAIVAQRPAVAVVDARMPGLDGVEIARRARTAAPETALLLFSGFADARLVEEALEAGAQGVAVKDAPLAELVRAVRLLAAGGRYLDPRLEARVNGCAPLTPRERDVLRLAADGLTNGDIATRLSISPETVQTHVRKAMAKLDAESRTQAVAKALRESLIS